MEWMLDELKTKRKEWDLLFQLCLKHKQFELLAEYWEAYEKLVEESE